MSPSGSDMTPEMEKLASEFLTAKSMIGVAKAFGNSPRKHIKEAERILETLRQLNCPLTFWFERKLEEELRK